MKIMAQKRFGGIVKWVAYLNRQCPPLRLFARIIVVKETIFYLFIIKLMSFTMVPGFIIHPLNQYTAAGINMNISLML